MPPITQQDLHDKQTEIRVVKEEMQLKQRELLRLDKEIARLQSSKAFIVQQKGVAGGAIDLAAKASDLATLKSEKERVNTAYKTARSLVELKLNEVQADLDPRPLTSMLNDSYPVFLLPVRTEVRFMTIKHITRFSAARAASTTQLVEDVVNGRDKLPLLEDRIELWVRIFPDDIFVQTHEAELTEEEVAAGQIFWKEIWIANRDEAKKLGAWRALVGGRGEERAAWVARALTPTNVIDLPYSPPENENEGGVDTVGSNVEKPDPVFPDVATKERSWTQAPKTNVLPDKFVVRLMKGNEQREIVGNAIPDPIYLNMNPLANEDNAGEENDAFKLEDDGKLVFPESLEWLTDFHEAERVGMALRIPISADEASDGFDKIIVLGIKHSVAPPDGSKLMEELFDNHIFSDGGFSTLPKGTKTNNDQQAESGYSSLNDDEARYLNIGLNETTYDQAEEESLKTDGQVLAEALGLSAEIGQRILNGDHKDSLEAIAMNKALWPASFGYFLSQMLHPLISPEEIEQLREYVCPNVIGRGKIPSIRVDDNPYGVLPITAFKRWKYAEADEGSLKDRLFRNLLQNMDDTWSTLGQEVLHADMTDADLADKVIEEADENGNIVDRAMTRDDLFLSIMGNHASSVEFYQRTAIGKLYLLNIFRLNASLQNATIPAGFEDILEINTIDFFSQFAWLNETATVPPNIFDLVFTQKQQVLNGSLIDQGELSENRRVEELAENWNYLRWLREGSYEQINKEDFSITGATVLSAPTALLYILLRDSLLLEYQRGGLAYLADKGEISEARIVAGEAANLGQLTIDSKKAVQYKRIALEEKRLTLTQIAEEADLEFDGVPESAERKRRVTEFRDQRWLELKPEVDQRIEEKLSQVEIDLLSLNPDEIFAKDHGDLTDNQPLSVYIDTLLLAEDPSMDKVAEIKEALSILETLPTARLERCFTEHIDTGSYRLDAWFQAMLHERLVGLRADNEQGVYVGAYSWLLDIKPGGFKGIHYEEVTVNPASVTLTKSSSVSIEFDSSEPGGSKLGNRLLKSGTYVLNVDQEKTRLLIEKPDVLAGNSDPQQAMSYAYLGNDGLNKTDIRYDEMSDQFEVTPREDMSNQGFIHATSINQATAAAVLRSAYEAHKVNSDDKSNKFAVNLNSDRVRRALFLLEGIKNGQSLGALLGYQFERRLHERTSSTLNLNALIYDLRIFYPQVAGSVVETDDGVSADKAAAYGVIDGLKLVEGYREDRTAWGNQFNFGNINERIARKAAIVEEIDRLEDSIDAINDLMMAESVYQVTLGNQVRAGAALKAVNGLGSHIDPEIIKTPRRFNALTHRLGLQFDLSVDGTRVWPIASALFPASPRSTLEPRLNLWLKSKLPDPERIVVGIQYDGIPEDVRSIDLKTKITVAELALQPIDFYFLLSQADESGGYFDLEKVIDRYIRESVLESDAYNYTIIFKDVELDYTTGELSIFTLLPIINQLKDIIGHAAPLSPLDLLMPGTSQLIVETSASGGLDIAELAARVSLLVSDDAGDADNSFKQHVDELADSLAGLDGVNFEDFAVIDTAAIEKLQKNLLSLVPFGELSEVSWSLQIEDSPSLENLIQRGKSVLNRSNDKLKLVKKEFDKITNPEVQVPVDKWELANYHTKLQEYYENIVKIIFGKTFRVYPIFTQYRANEYTVAKNYEDLLLDAGTDAVGSWVRGLSRVRERVRSWHHLDVFVHGLLGKGAFSPEVVQLPLLPIDDDVAIQARWLGGEFLPDLEIPGECLSLVFDYPESYAPEEPQAGMLIDQWVEEIPVKETTTGISLHYNSPNSEPPQACLLAVSPEVTGNWSWDDLMDALDETIDWAKKRAIDPDQLNKTPYAQVLPTIITALASSGENSISSDLRKNILLNQALGSRELYNLDESVVNERVYHKSASTDYFNDEILNN